MAPAAFRADFSNTPAGCALCTAHCVGFPSASTISVQSRTEKNQEAANGLEGEGDGEPHGHKAGVINLADGNTGLSGTALADDDLYFLGK